MCIRDSPPAELAALMAPKNAPVLQKVLTYHVVHLNLDSSKFKGCLLYTSRCV